MENGGRFGVNGHSTGRTICDPCSTITHPATPPRPRQGPTFALEQEEVGAVAEGGAEVGAVAHQVTGQALPVEGAHRVGAAGAEEAA